MADPYEHKEFPKMVYFENGSHRVVKNQDELSQAQSEGAKDSPADFGHVETPDSKAAAKTEADAATKSKSKRGSGGDE